jgi:hypothetical protein
MASRIVPAGVERGLGKATVVLDFEAQDLAEVVDVELHQVTEHVLLRAEGSLEVDLQGHLPRVAALRSRPPADATVGPSHFVVNVMFTSTAAPPYPVPATCAR